MSKWWPLTAICLGTFMLLVDVTIVNVALPSMATSLDSSFTSLQWVIDVYAVALAALLLVAGSVADRVGRRLLYLVGLVVFALASLACGLAPGVGALITARAVQGIGGAMMFATTTALIVASYAGRDRGTAFGIWGAVNGAAAAAGPIVGGLLTQHIGWRAIFLVNLPIALVAVLMTVKCLGESKNPKAPSTDYAGAVAFTVAAAALVYGLISGGDDGWTSARCLIALALSVVGLAVFIPLELHRPNAMLDVHLFRRPSFTALMIAGAILSGAAFAHLAYVSIWLQSVLGFGPVGAGLVTLPLSVAAFIVSALAGRFMHHINPRTPIGVGLLIIGAGLLALTIAGPASGGGALLLGMVVIGLGVGLGTPVLASATLAAVPHERAGMAGGAVNTFRQLGLAVGIAALGTAFAGRIQSTLAGSVPAPEQITAALTSGGYRGVLAATPADRRGQAATLIHTAFADGLDRIFIASGVAALIGGVLVLALVRPAPAQQAPATRPEAAPADA